MFLSFEKRRRRGTGGVCTCNHNEGLVHQNCHLTNGGVLEALPNDRMYGSTSALYQRPDLTNVNLSANVKTKASCQVIRSSSNIPKLLTPLRCGPTANNRSSFHAHNHPETSPGQPNSCSSTPVLSSGLLRRQTSLGHLEGHTSASGSQTASARNSDGGFGAFQQRIRAMLLPTKDSTKAKVNSNNTNDNQNSSVNQNSQSSDVMQRAGTSYTSQNTYAVIGSTVNSESMDAYNGIEDENDSFHLRDVCSKWFGQKQSPINHSFSSQMASAVNKTSLLSDSPKLSHNMKTTLLDKVVAKDSICQNSYTNSTNADNQLVNGSALGQPNPSDRHFDERHQLPNDSDLTTDGHVVVVSALECDTARTTSLTVRSELSSTEVSASSSAVPSGAYHSMQSQNAVNTTNMSKISDIHGSTDSTGSQEHNYKSSSDSGRGTMRGRGLENGLKVDSPDGVSPLDLTSLDSDQSIPGLTTSVWVNQNISQEPPEIETVSSNETIEKMQRELQRILEDNHSVQSSEVEVDDLGRSFQTRLSIVNESDSWTSNTPSQTPVPPQTGTTGKYCEPKADIKCSTIGLKTSGSKAYNTSKLKQKCITSEKQVIASSKQNIVNEKSKYSPLRAGKTAKTEQLSNTYSKTKINDRSHYNLSNRGKLRTASHPHLRSKERFINLVECDIGSTTTARDSNYLDDLSSEYTANTSLCGREDVFTIRKQLQGLEDMYSEIIGMLGSRVKPTDGHRARRKVCRSASSVVSGRSSVTSRGTRDQYYRRSKHEFRKHKSDETHSSRRLKRLESHVITLARSVAQLSTDMRYNHSLSQEVENLRQDMDLIRDQLLALKQCLSTTNGYGISSKTYHQSNGHISGNGRRVTTHLINPNKVEKLKRFFGDEPPLLRQFLKKLGYEKYARNFESEKIGITELPYLTEDRMQKLGIPLGPRMRIMQESHSQHKTINSNTDHYSLYAIV